MQIASCTYASETRKFLVNLPGPWYENLKTARRVVHAHPMYDLCTNCHGSEIKIKPHPGLKDSIEQHQVLDDKCGANALPHLPSTLKDPQSSLHKVQQKKVTRNSKSRKGCHQLNFDSI